MPGFYGRDCVAEQFLILQSSANLEGYIILYYVYSLKQAPGITSSDTAFVIF